jgi:hypothetical protein
MEENTLIAKIWFLVFLFAKLFEIRFGNLAA